MRELSEAASAYGSSMGRQNDISDPDFPVVFEIERLRWVDGDYDQGGAYWGHVKGEYIFRAEGESEDAVESMFVRAKNMEEAKASILETYPNATFASSADLEAFFSAYVEAALWDTRNSRYEDDPENEKEMLDDAGYDMAPECEEAMKQDCSDFLEKHGDLVARAAEKPGYTIERAGYDFWMTRSGSGVGYWDRGLGEVGDQLTEAAKEFKEIDLEVGDDDLIHASNEKREPTPSALGLG